MLKSELEKAAKDYSDMEMGCHAMRFFDSPEFQETPMVKAFRDGAKWALEWVKLNAYVVGNRFNLEIEEDETETKEK